MKKLKDKLQIYNSYISYYINQNTFKEIYMLSVILSIYASLLSRINGDVIDGIFNAFCFSTFLLCFYLLIIVNILLFNKFLDNSSEFFNMRIGSKFGVLKEKIKISLILNLFFNILFILLIFSLIFMAHVGHINNEIYKTYKITKATYLLYFTFRMLIINSVLTMFNVIIYEKFGIKVILFDLIFLAGLFVFPIQTDLKLTLNFYNILCLSHFKSFAYDLCSSFLTICTLIIIGLFLARISHRRKV